MQRFAGVMVASALALCLLVCAAPQPQSWHERDVTQLQTQMHTMALRVDPCARWRCEVHILGNCAEGTAHSRQNVLRAAWKWEGDWRLAYVMRFSVEQEKF